MPLPFPPPSPSFDRATALYLAHASDIAYHRSPTKAAHERLGLSVTPFRSKLTRTRGFLGLSPTYAVLSFRGSDPLTLPNWLTDAVVHLVPCSEYAGRVHQGFSSVLKHSWPKLQLLLDQIQDRPLFLTGHSMGGALAILAACRLAAAGKPPTAIYTFGSPRLADPDFCAAYSLPTYRLVNRLDLVPQLPLPSPKRLLPKTPRLTNQKVLTKLHRLADRLPSYAHVNTLVHLAHDGSITLDSQLQPWPAHAARRALATRGKSFHEGLTDHLISNYIRNLETPVTPPKPTPQRRRLKVD